MDQICGRLAMGKTQSGKFPPISPRMDISSRNIETSAWWDLSMDRRGILPRSLPEFFQQILASFPTAKRTDRSLVLRQEGWIFQEKLWAMATLVAPTTNSFQENMRPFDGRTPIRDAILINTYWDNFRIYHPKFGGRPSDYQLLMHILFAAAACPQQTNWLKILGLRYFLPVPLE